MKKRQCSKCWKDVHLKSKQFKNSLFGEGEGCSFSGIIIFLCIIIRQRVILNMTLIVHFRPDVIFYSEDFFKVFMIRKRPD